MRTVQRLAAMLVVWALGGALPAVHADAGPTPRNWQHGLSFFGDFKYPPDFRHFDYVDPRAPKGGRLVRTIGYSYNSFTPMIFRGLGAPGITVIGEAILYDSLIWPSSDEVGVFYGNLAGSIAVSDDSTEVRMRLRPEARWHDGVAVTAADVKFTFEHIRDNAFPGVKAAFLGIKQVDVISEREVRIAYHSPVNLNTMMALGKVPMLPLHYWRERDITMTTTTPPLGSGPYRIADFDIGRFVLYERVDDYWGKNLGIHRGRHNFDQLRFDVYRDATVRGEALRKGLIDYVTEASAVQWNQGYNIPARDKGLLIQDQHTFKQYVGVIQAIGFNTRRPRFADPRVREALMLALDFEWMSRVLDYAFFAKPRSFFHGTFLAAQGLPTPGELELLEPFRAELPERLFTEPFGLPSSNGRGRHREALLRARKLLREAGWRVEDNVLVNAEGQAFEIEFLVNNPATRRTLLPYVDQLTRLGIDARIRLAETAQYANLMRDSDMDAAMGAFAISFPPNREVVSYFSSHNRGFGNTAGIRSAAVDALVERVMNARTRDELTNASRALDRVLWWGFYYIPLRVIEGPRVIYWDKFGSPAREAPYRTAFPDAWWYDPEKAARVSAAMGD